jgi:hypothetical protein
MKDFYQVLKENIGDYSGRLDDIVYLAPDFFQLMTRLLDDPPIPEEAHGPYGYIDDVYVCALTAKKIIDELGDGSVLEENWEGEESIAKTLEDVLATDIDELKEKEEEILRYLGLEEE